MDTFNKIMKSFWLSVGIVTIVAVTYLGFTEGFDRWAGYYFLGFLALFAYFIRRFMMKRMEKHQEYLNNQKKENNKK